jgi:very-short-patch-repair endonuclease
MSNAPHNDQQSAACGSITRPRGLVDQAIDGWKAALLDLSKGNRLLFFYPGRGNLIVSHPSPGPLFDLISNEQRSLTFFRPDEDEVDDDSVALDATDTNPEAVQSELALLLETDEASTATTDTAPARRRREPRAEELVAQGEHRRIESTLYRLRLRSRTALQEHGINILFLAFGTLEWMESESSKDLIRSPLILVPVRLDRETVLDPYQISPLDEGLLLNPALARKLEMDFGLKLELPELEDPGLDMLLDGVRQAVAGRSSWSVQSNVHLGLFSFAKYAMYVDLELNRERLAGEPIIRTIAGESDVELDDVGELITADQLDDKLTPADVFQVLDADASQQEAIEAVKAGASLVVQGPPGTGKSQTITNIIAECLAQDKTVLFVSEKIAALKVVAKRLNEAGLSEFCLEAHSQDLDKATVIRELAAILEAGRRTRLPPSSLDRERIAALRATLNGYVRALHDPNNPLGMSAFQVHGALARLSDAPSIMFALPDPGGLTPRRLADLLGIVQHLVQASAVLLDSERHPWFGCLLPAFTPQLQTELDSHLRRLASTAGEAGRLNTEIRTTLGLPLTSTLSAIGWLLGLLPTLNHRKDVPRHWFESPSEESLRTVAADYQSRMHSYRERRARLLGDYSDRVFALDLDEIRLALRTEGKPFAARIRGSQEPTQWVLDHEAHLRTTVEEVMGATKSLDEAVAAVAEHLGLHPPHTIAQAQQVLQIGQLILQDPRPEPGWFDAGERLFIQELVAEATQKDETIRAESAIIAERFQPELFEVGTRELLDRFDETYASWTRVLRPGFHQAMGRLKRLQVAPQDLSYEQARDALVRANRVRLAREWLDAHRGELAPRLGGHYRGGSTDWPRVHAQIQTLEELFALLPERRWTEPLKRVLLGDHGGPATLRPAVEVLSAALDRTERSVAAFTDMVELDLSTLRVTKYSDSDLTSLANWIKGWSDGLVPFWEAANQLRATRRSHLTWPGVVGEVSEALDLIRIESELKAAHDELKETFGQLFEGLETDWGDVLDRLAWTGRVIEHFDGAPPMEFIDALERPTAVAVSEVEHLQSLHHELQQLLAEVRGWFASPFTIEKIAPEEAVLATVIAWTQAKRSSLPQLEEWLDLVRALDSVRAAGIDGFAQGVQREKISPTRWQDIFLRQAYTLWLTWRYTNCPELLQFRGRRHEDVVDEFRRLDRAQFRANAHRIAARLVEKRPVLSINLPPQAEPAILQREAAKRRRFRPLRKLFADLPHLLPSLKPCMLMSPLSVAQILGESGIQFDVVVFDEASQILPADAIGAIARGNQLVVVGDPQQLPPTRFFQTDLQFTEDEGEEELPESILDACLGSRFPMRRLLWHYRSRHEDLIAFSNRHFYERRLITFPSPQDRPAVEFIHVVDGVYRRGAGSINRVEATELVDLVVRYVEEQPDRSIGVITFSEPQMMAIQAEIDSRKRLRPELEELLREDGPEGFFVKNLENVQGDERDVIFFSVGYGPDQAGHMTMNFGPLNRQGGERRLNVAVTRARDEVKILASFRPHDIDLSRTQARGVHLLRNYLEFAERGPSALLGELVSEGGEPESPFEQAVADALLSRGLRVVSQVGVGGYRIDLGIKDELSGRYLLGIECDGATYHSTKTARDRDRLRDEVLHKLGWHIHRIWSTDWVIDPAGELERAVQAVERARNHIEETGATGPPGGVVGDDGHEAVPQVEGHTRSDEPSDTTVMERPEAPVDISQAYERVVFDEREFGWVRSTLSDAGISRIIVRCVEAEGPVHEERVMRAISEFLGYGRLGRNIRQLLLQAIEREVRSGRIVRRVHFLWPHGMTEPPVRALNSNGKARPIHEVAPEEIEAAIRTVLCLAFSIGREHLRVAVARALGYERTGGKVSQAIDDVISALIERQSVTDIDGQLRWSGQPC